MLAELNRHQTNFILIGGMNFMLRHHPVLTFDVDVWIEDEAENRSRTESALIALDAQWGPDEKTWGSVRQLPADWLASQSMFALTTRAGALDVFRHVDGLPSWRNCRARALALNTRAGHAFWSLADQDMLACQYALDERTRKVDRIRYLEALK